MFLKRFGIFVAAWSAFAMIGGSAQAEPVQSYERIGVQLASAAPPMQRYMQVAQSGTAPQVARAESLTGHWGYGCGSRDLPGAAVGLVSTAGQTTGAALTMPAADGSASYAVNLTGAGVGAFIMGIAISEAVSGHCGLVSQAYRALASVTGVCTYRAFGRKHESLGRLATNEGCV